MAASHMSMPNHWLPYSLVARAHSWSLRVTLLLTTLGAIGHVTTTVIVCAVISGLGGSLISHEIYTRLSAAVMLTFGGYYLYTYFILQTRTSCCDSDLGSSYTIGSIGGGGGSAMSTGGGLPKPPTSPLQTTDAPGVHRAAAVSLVALTALSPCVGSMPVLLGVLRPPVHAGTAMAAWMVLAMVAVGVMVPLVGVSYLGAAMFPLARFRRHERVVLGMSLVMLAVVTLFVLPAHDHDHHHDHGHHHHAVDGHGRANTVAREGHVVHGGMHTAGEKKYVDGMRLGADGTRRKSRTTGKEEKRRESGTDLSLKHDMLRTVTNDAVGATGMGNIGGVVGGAVGKVRMDRKMRGKKR